MRDEIKQLIRAVYEARRDREVHPEGTFDGAQRWYPSDRENGEKDVTYVRGPSRSGPLSYMHRARTKQHCKRLVERAIAGHDVPEDVQRAALMLRLSPEQLAAVRARVALTDQAFLAAVVEEVAA